MSSSKNSTEELDAEWYSKDLVCRLKTYSIITFGLDLIRFTPDGIKNDVSINMVVRNYPLNVCMNRSGGHGRIIRGKRTKPQEFTASMPVEKGEYTIGHILQHSCKQDGTGCALLMECNTKDDTTESPQDVPKHSPMPTGNIYNSNDYPQNRTELEMQEQTLDHLERGIIGHIALPNRCTLHQTSRISQET